MADVKHLVIIQVHAQIFKGLPGGEYGDSVESIPMQQFHIETFSLESARLLAGEALDALKKKTGGPKDGRRARQDLK